MSDMPGAAPITSTWALTNATMPYVVGLATDGLGRAVETHAGLMAGVNVAAGRVTCRPVAESQGREYVAPDEALREACAVL